MNQEDLETIRGFTRRTAAIVMAVRQLAALTAIAVDAIDVAAMRADLATLEAEIEAFVEDISAREAVSWGDRCHRRRHEPTRRIPLSTEVEPNARVQRFGPDGRPQGSRRDTPPSMSGRWTKWRSEQRR